MNMRSISWLALFFLLTPAAVLAQFPERPLLIAQDDQKRFEAQQLFNRANDKSSAGDFAGAINDYNRAIRLYPGYYQAFGGRAEARRKSGDLQGAIADYQQMVRIFPNDVGVYHNLGKLYFQLQDYPQVVVYTTEALNRNGDLKDVHQLRANALIRQGDFGRALEDFDAILGVRAPDVVNPDNPEVSTFSPDDAPVLARRALLYQRLGRYTEALADYNAALRLDPKLSYAYGWRASLRSVQGSNLSTLDDCDAAIKANAATALIYYIQGNARFNLGQKALATAAYEQAVALPFGSDAIPAEDLDYKARADARFNQKQLPESLADYDQALRFNPNYAEAYFKRGSLKLELADRTGALADLQKAQQLFAGRGDKFNADRAQALVAKLQT
ncbi:TPR repeat protein [Gloeobacter kilaueensis JS1]|uniref:TPR repeat protein n=2 Tax=Gloeobacter TaxID=33071 RepID=U5QJY7_GLOK1|nr:TPR repeat protein [Gloeobacter kilaueensis JS1]